MNDRPRDDAAEGALTRGAVAIVRGWTTAYTSCMASNDRKERREEIDGDLDAHSRDHDGSDVGLALSILGRFVRGIPADLLTASSALPARAFGRLRGAELIVFLLRIAVFVIGIGIYTPTIRYMYAGSIVGGTWPRWLVSAGLAAAILLVARLLVVWGRRAGG